MFIYRVFAMQCVGTLLLYMSCFGVFCTATGGYENAGWDCDSGSYGLDSNGDIAGVHATSGTYCSVQGCNWLVAALWQLVFVPFARQGSIWLPGPPVNLLETSFARF